MHCNAFCPRRILYETGSIALNCTLIPCSRLQSIACYCNAKDVGYMKLSALHCSTPYIDCNALHAIAMPKTWAVRPLGHGSCQPPHHQPRPTQGAQVVNTNMCILYKYTYSTIQLSVYFNLQYGDIVTVVLKHLDSNEQLDSVTELCCELWELWSGFVRTGIVTLMEVLVWRPLS